MKGMKGMKGSGDSEEEKLESQKECTDEGEIWNQLGDWAKAACILVGVSQARRQGNGPGCACCAINVLINVKTQKRLKLFEIFCLFVLLILVFLTPKKMTQLEVVESSCSQKSTPSPQLRSKWRVRTNGWQRSSQCQHSSSHWSLSQLFPLFLLCSTSTALCCVSPLGVICLGKVNEAKTGTFWWLLSWNQCVCGRFTQQTFIDTLLTCKESA